MSFLPAGVGSQESESGAIVRVRRSGGEDGDVSVSYRTVADGEGDGRRRLHCDGRNPSLGGR